MRARTYFGGAAIGALLVGALLGTGVLLVSAGSGPSAATGTEYPGWVKSAQAAADGDAPGARRGDPVIARLAVSRNAADGPARARRLRAATADYRQQFERSQAAANSAAANSVNTQAAGATGQAGATEPGNAAAATSVAEIPATTTLVFAGDPAWAKAYAAYAVYAWGWSGGEYACLNSLWERESNWRVNAYNHGSGAYGIPQSLPGDKMATAGSDWQTSAATQIDWGLGYIAARYGAPCGAWAHSESVNWY